MGPCRGEHTGSSSARKKSRRNHRAGPRTEDLAVLVSDQDEAAEALETNVGRTVEDVEAAGEQLLQAEGYQQRGRRCKLMLAAVLAAVVVAIVVLAARGD